MRVKGRWWYLYRALDATGTPIDFVLSEVRDAAAATRLFCTALTDPSATASGPHHAGRGGRRPRRPVGRSPPFRPVASSPGPGLAAGRRERPRRAVAHAALPRGGVPDGVRHLRVLLAGAGLLWGALPRDRATGPRAAGVRQASAQPGRPARSLRPPTGLPREMSPPRDSGTFPPPPSIPHHRSTRQARG